MDRLRIRRFKKDDLQALYELLSDEDVMCYIEPPYSFPQTEAFLHSAACLGRRSFMPLKLRIVILSGM